MLPVKSDLRIIKNAWRYIATARGFLTILFSIIFLTTLLLILSQATLLFDVLTTHASLTVVISLLGSIVTSLPTLFPTSSMVFIVLSATIFGINITLARAYRKKTNTQMFGTHTQGFLALLASLFGVGCASCGPLLFANLLFSLTGVSVAAYLPFGGVEFAVLGLLFLLWSTYALMRVLANPLICKT